MADIGESMFSGTLSVPLSTNISIALPGHLIAKALQSFCEGNPLDREGLPTLESMIPKDGGRYEEINWETIFLPKQRMTFGRCANFRLFQPRGSAHRTVPIFVPTPCHRRLARRC
jgi:hypothetical protein